MIAREGFSAAAVSLAASAVLAAAAVGANTPFGPMTRVASGHWGGHPWTLDARTHVGGDQVESCIFVVVDAGKEMAGGGGNCGGGFVLRPFRPGSAYGVQGGWYSACPSTAVMAGAVVARARVVKLELRNGSAVRTPTIAPPAGLAKGVRFWILRLPCAANPALLVALDGTGKVVGRVPDLHFPASATR